MTEYKIGDRVRLTYEGVVTAVNPNWVSVPTDDGTRAFYASPDAAEIELIERTPRVFQKGDLIPEDVTALQLTGDREVIFRIAAGGWWRALSREVAESETAGYASGGWTDIEWVGGFPMTEVIEGRRH
jgi:hypothetical protein